MNTANKTAKKGLAPLVRAAKKTSPVGVVDGIPTIKDSQQLLERMLSQIFVPALINVHEQDKTKGLTLGHSDVATELSKSKREATHSCSITVSRTESPAELDDCLELRYILEYPELTLTLAGIARQAINDSSPNAGQAGFTLAFFDEMTPEKLTVDTIEGHIIRGIQYFLKAEESKKRRLRRARVSSQKRFKSIHPQG